MIILKKIAILFFDIIDKYYHQNKILNYLKLNCEKLEILEPQKKIYKYLKQKYNRNKKIKIYNVAISDKKKMQTLYINKHDLTSSLTQIDKNNKYLNLKARLFGGTINDLIQKKYMISSYKLLDIIKNNKIRQIDLLKIDTEGHELQVLKGAGSFLKNNIKYILIEIHNSDIFLNYNAKKIDSYLKKNKFVVKKSFKFPFTTWEDRIYQNKKFN
jgi:FkbM family methyltransferase